VKLARLSAGVALALLGGTPLLGGERSPEQVVRSFFKAYDRRDAEAMAALLQTDAALWKLGEERPAVSGREGFRRLFLERFREHPKARAKIAESMELGGWIVVREKTTLEPGEPARDRLSAFEVAGGAIRREWVLEGASGEEDFGGGEGRVALQIEKYNEKDLPRLLATYDEGATLYLLSTGERLAAGEEALREHFEKIFEESPRLRTEVLQRMALGSWVVYRERTVMGADDRRVESIVIYEVRDDLIRRVWFAR
jgi:hypothetical protein